jgi:hypothetical protein
MQRSPITQSSPTVTRDFSTVPAPMRAPRSTTHSAPMRRLGIDLRLGVDHRARVDGGPADARGAPSRAG